MTSTLSRSFSRHRAITHVSFVAAVMLAALVLSLQGAAAGPTPVKTRPASILPQSLGAGIKTDSTVTIRFDAPVDRQAVLDSLNLRPATSWTPSWSDDGRSLYVAPGSRWLTDARYVIRIAQPGAGDAQAAPATLTYSFTTETAPLVNDFQLFYAEESPADRVRAVATEDTVAAQMAAPSSPPADTAADVSAATRITVGFSVPMDREDVAQRFAIRPAVAGSLSWEGNALVFSPSERLTPGARYAVSVVGAHDAHGNRLAGDTSFSFTTREGAQAVKVAPASGSTVGRDSGISIWFSQPMDVAAAGTSFELFDVTRGSSVAGAISWNDAMTQLTFKPSSLLAYGHTFRIALADAQDLDRNSVSGTWTFATNKAPAPPPRPVVRSTTTAPSRPAGPPPPSDIQQFALWQINQARAQYGFAPLKLDAAITAEATAYAWDMMNYNYFSHIGRDGSHVSDRLRRAGISFSWSGENICYYNGLTVKATLQWCHSVFMSEPYPGVANHIGNILGPHYTRVGIGIAQSGSRIKIVWDFAG